MNFLELSECVLERFSVGFSYCIEATCFPPVMHLLPEFKLIIPKPDCIKLILNESLRFLTKRVKEEEVFFSK